MSAPGGPAHPSGGPDTHEALTGPGLAELREILGQFAIPGRALSARPQPGGHIHRSYRVQVGHDTRNRAVLLQALNRHVFPDLLAVVENCAAVTGRLHAALRREGVSQAERRVPRLVPTADGAPALCDAGGNWWRVFHFIEDTHCSTTLDGPDQALAAAGAYGAFARRLSAWSDPPLHRILPGFHDTAARLDRLRRAARTDPLGRAAGCAELLAFAERQRQLCRLLPALTAHGELPERVAHNDAKPANVLFDLHSGEALCVIDLDTVMPGSCLHDFGDLVRSMTSTAGEDRTGCSGVAVDPTLLEAVARGWLSQMADLMTPVERQLLVFAGLLITYEQGLRFLTDHLEGDRYFRIPAPGHNLARAANQFALARSLSERRGEWERLLASL